MKNYVVTLQKSYMDYDEDGDLVMMPETEPIELLKIADKDAATAFAERLTDIYNAAVFGEIRHVSQDGRYGIIEHYQIYTIKTEGWGDQYTIVVNEEDPD